MLAVRGSGRLRATPLIIAPRSAQISLLAPKLYFNFSYNCNLAPRLHPKPHRSNRNDVWMSSWSKIGAGWRNKNKVTFQLHIWIQEDNKEDVKKSDYDKIWGKQKGTGGKKSVRMWSLAFICSAYLLSTWTVAMLFFWVLWSSLFLPLFCNISCMPNWIETWGVCMARSSPWVFCHVTWTIPECDLCCGGAHYFRGCAHSPTMFGWVTSFVFVVLMFWLIGII